MRPRIKVLSIITLLCAALVSSSISAETVYLRGGKKVTGVLIGQGRTWVALRVNGRRRVIRKSRIRRISYRRTKTATAIPIPATKKKAAAAKRKKAAAERRKKRIARDRARRARARRRAAARRKAAAARAAAARKKAEDNRRKAAAKKKAEDDKRKAAAIAAAKKKAEDDRRKAAAIAAAKKKAEDDRRKAAAIAAAKKKAEDDKRRVAAIAAAKKKAEDDKRKAAAIAAAAKKKAEDDKRRAAAKVAAAKTPAAKKKAEDNRRKVAAAAAAAKKKAEDDKRKATAAADATKKAKIAALKRKQEEDRKKAIAMRKRAEDNRRRARKEPTSRDSAKVSGWRAALWSAALPGLGQWLQGRRGEAITYGSLFAVGVAGAYDSNRLVLNATRDYNETSNPFSTTTLIQQSAGINVIPTAADLADPAKAALYTSNFELQKQAVDDHYRTYQRFAAFAGLIYAWNIADAWLADTSDPNVGYAADVPPLKAAMWSAIIPGWGQWKTNRRNTGIFYASAVAVGLVGMYEKNREVKNASRDYDELNNPYSTSTLLSIATGVSTGQPATDALGASIVDNQFSGQRDALDRHSRELKQLGYLTLGIYIWSVADAFLFTRSSPGKLAEAPPTNGLQNRGFAFTPVLVPGTDTTAPSGAMRFAWNFSF